MDRKFSAGERPTIMFQIEGDKQGVFLNGEPLSVHPSVDRVRLAALLIAGDTEIVADARECDATGGAIAGD